MIHVKSKKIGFKKLYSIEKYLNYYFSETQFIIPL